MYILLVILLLIVYIIWMKYNDFLQFFEKVAKKYESMTNAENIKKQMADLENVDKNTNTKIENHTESYYTQTLNKTYDIVSLKYFNISDNVSKSWQYFYEYYLLPIYYKNFYVNTRKNNE